MKNSFVFYGDWWEAIKTLPLAQGNKVLRAICDYALSGQPPTDPIVAASFAFIRTTIDRDREKWEEVREKRKEAGLKGAQATNGGCTKNRQMPASADKCRQMPASADKCRQMPASAAVYVNEDVNVNENVDNLTFSNEKVEYGLASPKPLTIGQRLKGFLGSAYNSRAKKVRVIWNEEVKGELPSIVPPYAKTKASAKRRVAIDIVLLKISESNPGASPDHIIEQYREFVKWVVQTAVAAPESNTRSGRSFDVYMTAEYVEQWLQK